MKRLERLVLCATLLMQLICLATSASVAVMSVDLGNEFIKIGIVSPGKSMETVLNTDSSRKTQNIVAFRDGERHFGEAAVSIGIRFPEKVYTHLLDLIGKSIDHPIVQNYMKRFPYHKISANEKGDGLIMTHPEGDVFTPEELLAMILERTRIYAEHFLANDIPIKDTVIVIPAYLTQAERKAVLTSAKIAGLNVLQLVNGNTAVSLNYGLFRLNDLTNDQAKNIIFFDMGSTSTEVTVASFQMRKKNEGAYPITVPELTIRGIGFDRTLGGFEMQLRLRDFLANEFSKQSKVLFEKVRNNQRAMSKLLKEAGRVKIMLSANNEIQARVENVMNDIDLKVMISREEYENICLDLLTNRVTKPLEDALLLSGLTGQEIEQVVLFGGNTRTPRVQKSLLEFLASHELSKNVNSDEAASLGAAYLAAGLSKGFKVKHFDVRELNLFPISIDFVRDISSEEIQKSKVVQRVLFAKGNSYPVRKVLTFSKNVDDFDFYINYGDLTFLNPIEQANIGLKNISKVRVTNLKQTIEDYLDERYEHKGIKAHFHMDENGLLRLERIEYALVEKVEVMVEAAVESGSGAGDTLASLGNKISNFFSSGNESNIVGDTLSNLGEQEQSGANSEQDTNGTLNSNLGETVSNLLNKVQGSNESDTVTASGEESKKTKTGGKDTQDEAKESSTENTSESTPSGEQSAEPKNFKKEIKLKPIKVPITFEQQEIQYSTFNDELVQKSIEKLRIYSEKENSLKQKEQAKNTLESFIVETRVKLLEDEYERSSTEQEREALAAKLAAASEWLEYESDGADTTVFNEKLKELTNEFNELFNRVHEHRQRPEALSALNNLLNVSSTFLNTAKTLPEDDQIFTDVEIGTLEKAIQNTEQWRDEKIVEQESTQLHETPKLQLKIIQEKISVLDREFKYLLHKAQIAPKKKKTEKKKEDKEGETTEEKVEDKQERKTTEEIKLEDAEEKPENVEEKEPAVQSEVPVESGEPMSPTNAGDINLENSHTEL